MEHVRLLTVLSDTELFRVTHNAVLLTVRGHGTAGVRAGVAEYRNRRGRCGLGKTQVVEGQRVRVDEAQCEAVILECKSTIFLFHSGFQASSFIKR